MMGMKVGHISVDAENGNVNLHGVTFWYKCEANGGNRLVESEGLFVKLLRKKPELWAQLQKMEVDHQNSQDKHFF